MKHAKAKWKKKAKSLEREFEIEMISDKYGKDIPIAEDDKSSTKTIEKDDEKVEKR